MRITKKVTTVGSSLGILIDKPLIKKLKLNKDDYVEIDIKKV